MRRAHRRLHLALWILLAPAVAIGVYLALSHRQGEPRTELPDALAEDAP